MLRIVDMMVTTLRVGVFDIFSTINHMPSEYIDHLHFIQLGQVHATTHMVGTDQQGPALRK